ncbi:3-phosphoglycerate dehydrogenase [Kiloniella litopenaei]|uniref:D-3-phosphoglycerate dehydrogenase n=1 Tax=Kiloniella litopenaei TaxID=1549748 RepID=A0A0M2R8K1_9PROT|nr:phosphoglycerate dehydrogenase [Kiloniella litopenaei]KKJ76305.1 3-phosphoglycerate dehydrogenase [Kiloniella litopenaei]
MVKVLISDKLSPKAADIFRDRGVEVDTKVGLSEEELIAIIGDYDGLAIRSATKVTPQVLEAATNLKVVGRAGIGVDNVNIDAASAKGVVVMNTPHGNSITTAEHAIAMMFAAARQIPEANESTQAGKWEKSRFMGSELTAKTLGVIGCGNIGSIVVDRAQGLKMKVISFDPFLSPERAKDLGVEKVELDELLARADFITLHVPLTDQTKGIIDAKALAKTKKGVRIINCARGGLVVEADLKEALESGHVAGAASDVFEVEPAKDSVLFGAPNFVATPHLGASTAEAQENVALQVAEQLSDYLLTGAVTNALNMPSLTAEEFNKLEPYMTLSQQLGSFAGQLTQTGLKAIKIDYEGSVASLNCRPLTQTIVASLLAPIMDSVNVVSAPVIARERNIDVSEAKHERDCDFQTLIRLTVTTEKGERSVAGTLFGGKRPRLVNIKGIEIEAELGKHMLYLTNEDTPGYIGALGMQLGEAGVNIATFHLGRTAPGQDAIALVELDSPLDAAQIEKVKQLPQTKQVVQLNF